MAKKDDLNVTEEERITRDAMRDVDFIIASGEKETIEKLRRMFANYKRAADMEGRGYRVKVLVNGFLVIDGGRKPFRIAGKPDIEEPPLTGVGQKGGEGENEKTH